MGSGNQDTNSLVRNLFEGVGIEPNAPDLGAQVAADDLSTARSPGQEDDTAPPLPLRHYYLKL